MSLEIDKVSIWQEQENKIACISPYNRDFLDTVDQEIRNLLLFLNSRNILTLSSCGGHYSTLPYVTIGTSSLNCCKRIAKLFEVDPFISLNFFGTLSPYTIKFLRNEKKEVVGLWEIPNDLNHQQKVINHYNKICYRNYEDWSLLKVIWKSTDHLKNTEEEIKRNFKEYFYDQ
jgi:hypothetical protein